MNETDPIHAADVRSKLQAVSKALRCADHLSPDARQRLADLVEELSQAVDSPAAPSANAVHLSESVARLARAIEENHEPGLLESARGQIERAVVSVETETPVLSGIAMRFIQALSDIGI